MVLSSPSGQSQWTIDDHHAIFLFGDLNYRTTQDNRDELKQQTSLLKTYSEAKINFPATYKYKCHTPTYDLSRRPSWTDRILHRSAQHKLESVDYWSPSMINFSDHRPVANLFRFSRFIRR